MILRMIYSYSMKKYVLTNRLPFLTLFIITFIIIGFRLKIVSVQETVCFVLQKTVYTLQKCLSCVIISL